MTGKELHTLTAAEMAPLVRDGELKALELAQCFIDRLPIDERLHAWVCVDRDYVISQAGAIDRSGKQGALAGVPIGIKDIFNTEFYPTERGSAAWHGYKAGNDARCVSYLRNEGGIIFGKTDTSELAVHANGKALNPHHLGHVTGSSSGGSAAAVAAGLIPIALGSQTGGSTIRPASWCGVHAMKPSFGLIPRTGVLKTTDTLDTIGFFGRCVEDLELMLETLRVHGRNFPLHEQKLKEYVKAAGSRWRIGFCKSHLTEATQPQVLQALEGLRRDLLSVPDVEVVDLRLPASTLGFREVHRHIYHPDLGYYLKAEMARAPDKMSTNLISIFEDSKTIPPEAYQSALQKQVAIAADLENFFLEHRLDAIFMNSSDGSAPVGHEPEFHNDLNSLWTLAWVPVINIPQFRCSAGLPFGLQAVGPKFSDYRLFDLLKHLSSQGAIVQKSAIMDPPFKQ